MAGKLIDIQAIIILISYEELERMNYIGIALQTISIEILFFFFQKPFIIYITQSLFYEKAISIYSFSNLSYVSFMSAILQQSISSFFKLSHNNHLGSSNSMTEGNIAMFYFLHIFYSKCICKLVLILLISLLLTWTSTWLTNTCSIAKFFAPGFITTTC